MLITPRTYSASQISDNPPESACAPNQVQRAPLAGRHPNHPNADQIAEMPLIWQTGSVRVGEVIRYTLKYSPAADEIQPPSSALFVRIKNTSAIPLRAAYLHGPYTLYTSCYPNTFDPNITTAFANSGDVPQFEPYLKAGGVWNAAIPVSRPKLQEGPDSYAQYNVTWVIEIISQVVFSNTASVNFEVLIGRDEASLEDVASSTHPTPLRPADLLDHWPSGSDGRQMLVTKGVYSRSVHLLLDDTASLWNTPHLPTEKEASRMSLSGTGSHKGLVDIRAESGHLGATAPGGNHRRKIHLVILTHGLHSNLGADMLYLKESIDSAFRRARPRSTPSASAAATSPKTETDRHTHDWEDEDIVVRGFPGNAARTERGIQYLGKRLAKYVLLLTYPDQPHLPNKKSKGGSYLNPFTARGAREKNEFKAESARHKGGQLHADERNAYQITSISFVGHSLGGLVQTYAIAYIQKHSPEFFDKIRPINFIALATPFLGLSNENPMYVRFALDLGLVGRTGQDLGLSWTTPRVRSGWESIIGGKGDSKSRTDPDTYSRPLLRILPSGPAHEVLAKFKRRTLYSNLVNDGIVPLRTSCLLFLDWKGLQRVEKTRRENGLVGTMAEWGWAELTGANSKSSRSSHPSNDEEVRLASVVVTNVSKQTPQVDDGEGDFPCSASCSPRAEPVAQAKPGDTPEGTPLNTELNGPFSQPTSSPLGGVFSFFKHKEHKQAKVLKRSQTIASSLIPDPIQQDGTFRNHAAQNHVFNAPPKTTFFESAGDLLMPPLPEINYIVNPASRPRTILHDRVYNPEDIPQPTGKQQATAASLSKDETRLENCAAFGYPADEAGLKVEEKIARAYHRGLSWRKVLVRLEPDAHNNIIVRRMFANAYGWPVVQHLVDSHFGSSSRDSVECTPDENPERPSPSAKVAEDKRGLPQITRADLNGGTGSTR
ncbi:putative serine esterase-domain-containing protein [Aspergillus unguis]